MFSTALNYSKEEKNSIQTLVSGTGGEDNQFSYGISGNSQGDEPSGYAVNGGYRSPYVNIAAIVGHDAQNNNQRSFSVSGAVVAHPHGVTLSNDLNSTFAIIHAEGAQGAVINGAPGSRLDFWRNDIVPYVTPYEKSQVSTNPSNLDLSVELSATEREIIPRANSATLVEFDIRTRRSLLSDIRVSTGNPSPMVSEVLDEHGQLTGYAARAGKVFTRGLPEEGHLGVVWGPDNKDRCSFVYHVAHSKDDM